MADNSTLARPYAKAVFELARESGQLQSWSASLQSIAGLVADPKIAGLIAHPALSRADLAAVLAKAFGDASKEVLSLVRVLIENGRLSVVAEIAAQYEQLRAEAGLLKLSEAMIAEGRHPDALPVGSDARA